MGCGTVRSVLVLCVVIYLIKGVNLLHCPRYKKYEAIERGLLNDRAACRALKYDYEDMICLNGFKSSGFFCATGSCNMFGHNCDGHCLSGRDNTDEEHDYSLTCNTTALEQRDILCKMYSNQLGLLFKIVSGQAEINERLLIIFPFSPASDITMRILGDRSAETLLETIKRVCPWTFRLRI